MNSEHSHSKQGQLGVLVNQIFSIFFNSWCFILSAIKSFLSSATLHSSPKELSTSWRVKVCLYPYSSAQSLIWFQLFVTPWTAACQALLSIINFQSLFKFMSFESVMPSNQLILCHSFLLVSSVFSNNRVFSKESDLCIRWPEYWVSASVFPMNIQDWFPLGWTGWISLQSKRLSRVLSHTTFKKHQFFCAQLS